MMDLMVCNILSYFMCILSDIAVSAPFEGSGVVYIYHGQQMDEQGSIINTTIQQVYIIVLHYVVSLCYHM